jgi:Head domain of trimeric autotransporter adhesin
MCGAATRAAAAGLAFQNPDGTIGFRIAIVVSPGGVPLHVDAAISLPSPNGTWRDSSGHSGAFVFNPGAALESPRPPPAPVFPAGLFAGLSAFTADGGFVARSTFGVGGVPAAGAGARLLWHPGKAAIRAGEGTGASWDEASVGARSVAFGHDTRASGANSVAMGEFTTASGANRIAVGLSTTARRAFAISMARLS